MQLEPERLLIGDSSDPRCGEMVTGLRPALLAPFEVAEQIQRGHRHVHQPTEIR
jgi:hypothetical protein